LGKALIAEGATEEGVSALQKATELDPGDPSPHFLLARALAKMGQTEASKRQMDIFSQLKKSQATTGGMATGRAH
jgi:Flp pilus assembly protein TadD